MATVQLWRGIRRVVLGNTFTNGEYIEVDAEQVGALWEEHNSRGTETVFYRASDGRFVVHQRRWSYWENEPEISDVFVFPSPGEAEAMFWWELEQAGLIPPRSIGLDEVTDR